MAELDGFEAAMREELEDRAQAFGRQSIELWAEEVETHLRAATPPDTASMDEWNMEPIIESREIRQDGDRWVLEYTAETEDGLNIMDLMEFGTEPHDIPGDPILAFPDRETGETIFRHKVRHPGTPAVAAVRIGKRRLELKIEREEIEEALP